MAARQGLAPLFPTADTLLAAHATYWIENRSTLRIALPVAVANVNSKFLSAYRLENGKHNIHIKVNIMHMRLHCFIHFFRTDNNSGAGGASGRIHLATPIHPYQRRQVVYLLTKL